MSLKPAVIFDLDGTLADTSGDLIAAANHCLATRGFETRWDAKTDMFTAFAGGRAMLTLGYQRAGMSDGVEAALAEDYQRLLDFYGENIDKHTILYPGVEAALDRLADAGYALGICTNKPEGLAETLMKRLNLRDRFGALIGADTLEHRKPHAMPLFETINRVGGDPSRSMLIGDTITDRKTGVAANIPCVLVTFGPTGRQVEEMKPDALLDHYDDLFDLAEKMLS